MKRHHKSNTQSGFGHLMLPLLLVVLALIALIGAVVYSRYNEANAYTWTPLGQDSTYSISVLACKTQVASGKSGKGYLIRAEYVLPPKGGGTPPPYALAIVSVNAAGAITSELNDVSGSTYNGTAGTLTAGTTLYPSLNQRFMLGVGTTDPVKGGYAGYTITTFGPFAADQVGKC